ncbi:Uncharacterised protein [Enterobacter roggenkampii]|uniref:Uncharacterized protein n=1 Tax=Enterobacter roggenkampii TaxID=1812935 RepID=A0ABY0IZD9_9ENTR|nr:Uncharacterised protein [Enterobacter roggenkampii]
MLFLFILLSIWLYRPSEKLSWPDANSTVSMPLLVVEHPARVKGTRETRAY